MTRDKHNKNSLGVCLLFVFCLGNRVSIGEARTCLHCCLITGYLPLAGLSDWLTGVRDASCASDCAAHPIPADWVLMLRPQVGLYYTHWFKGQILRWCSNASMSCPHVSVLFYFSSDTAKQPRGFIPLVRRLGFSVLTKLTLNSWAQECLQVPGTTDIHPLCSDKFFLFSQAPYTHVNLLKYLFHFMCMESFVCR